MTAALVVLSCLVYAAGLLLLRDPARRPAGIGLAALGGIALAIVTLP